ncbi:hypothetical protein [Tuberibacillus sp. Marseille-P3662]|uniref:hypothetical protein n=1 Tax=Tuberibacillus sp. Marseille-P3662 TaxID=1965358 RepID=UPI000A1C8242|nr:hypothetical protein [Tuberibacillus sp. Marseille-P3662]
MPFIQLVLGMTLIAIGGYLIVYFFKQRRPWYLILGDIGILYFTFGAALFSFRQWLPINLVETLLFPFILSCTVWMLVAGVIRKIATLIATNNHDPDEQKKTTQKADG